jgi:hypothetical protein
VTADVRGNLGPASVVTSGLAEDWLKDRWQAARNMQGAPIPGPHWLEIDLGAACVVESVEIDFETAYSKDYVLYGLAAAGTWARLAVGADAEEARPAKQHVRHRLRVTERAPVTRVKMDIRRPATRWGTSVWALDVRGACG